MAFEILEKLILQLKNVKIFTVDPIYFLLKKLQKYFFIENLNSFLQK